MADSIFARGSQQNGLQFSSSPRVIPVLQRRLLIRLGLVGVVTGEEVSHESRIQEGSEILEDLGSYIFSEAAQGG